MIKRLSMILVLAFSAILAGCSSPASPGTSPADGASPPAESAPASPEESLEESPAAS